MDSQVCWLMNPTWKPVYVAHGAEQEVEEIKALANIRWRDSRFQPCVLRLGFAPDIERDGHIAHRNALLLTAALAAFPKADAVAYGALLGEGSGDKSSSFARHLAESLSIGEGRPIKVLRPLRHMTKAQALRKGIELDNCGTLDVTTSCYHGTACGRCQPCFRLGIAQYLNGLRSDLPALPTETKGVRATLRANSLSRWPALALANTDVIRAHGLYYARSLVGKSPARK